MTMSGVISTAIQVATAFGGLGGVAAWFQYRRQRRRAGASDASSARQLSESAAALLEPYQRALSDLGQQLAAATARARDLEAQLLAAQAETQDLRNQVAAMAKEVDTLRTENTELRTQPFPPINPSTT